MESGVLGKLDFIETKSPVISSTISPPAGHHGLDVPIAPLHTPLALRVPGLAIHHLTAWPQQQQLLDNLMRKKVLFIEPNT